MTDGTFLTRVVLRNYKSIANCDVHLGPLTYLVGLNGSGKSNFLDALHFVRDALAGSLDNALNERGGISEVRRRSGGHPTHFGIRLEFRIQNKKPGHYTFKVGALPEGGYEVQMEECTIGGEGKGPFFRVERGNVVKSSEETFPAVMADRLALVNASGLPVFRPVFDALKSMNLYNLNPKLIREYQKPQDGRFLKSAGENIASVLGHLKRTAPESIQIIHEYLQIVVPTIRGVERKRIGPWETLEFQEGVVGTQDSWQFYAWNMSDGTLRALGILTALFQGNRDYAPSLIGIEEPETALHPGASGALREALQRASRKTQVIVTSHSPDLLDDMDLLTELLLAVVSGDGDTRFAPLDETSKSILRDGLFSAGEWLRQDQLKSDPEVFEEQKEPQSDLFE
uniref:Predicted ATPase n=1 Tax=Candidatus Kentrum sp. LFY TaxID=2126342 RepID=A0A450UJN0_9GAMM|nr:MAG: Predicted ATPase [Candidatus Kentron sp. LFY]